MTRLHNGGLQLAFVLDIFDQIGDIKKRTLRVHLRVVGQARRSSRPMRVSLHALQMSIRKSD